LLKRMAEGLAGKGHEIHAVCHGSSFSVKVHSPGNFWLYTKAFSFPLASFFSFRKLVSVLDEFSFDAAIIKIPSFSGSGFWFNSGPLIESGFYSAIGKELKKRGIPFFVFAEGITEKENFLSSFMGCSGKQQFTLMNESKGIVCLSRLQNRILFSEGINRPMSFFPAPADTEKYVAEKKGKGIELDGKKINLLYLSSSCDTKDFIPFFGFLEKNDCVLFVVSPFSVLPESLQKELEKKKLEGKVRLVSGFPDENLFQLIPFFDAGVYLKKFGFAFADSSYMMKISEYLSCGLPVLVPEMKGPLEQAGKAAVNFERTGKISKQALKKLSAEARKTAVEGLDLKKSVLRIEGFIHENS